MIHHSCDRCKRVIDPLEDLRYVVKLEVQAAMDPLDADELEDDRDYLLNPSYSGKYRHSIHADIGVQCSTCHDPHGSQNFPRLLNFNLDFVSPNSLGCINYTTDASTSKCGLSCHVPGLPTKDHVIGGASGC